MIIHHFCSQILAFTPVRNIGTCQIGMNSQSRSQLHPFLLARHAVTTVLCVIRRACMGLGTYGVPVTISIWHDIRSFGTRRNEQQISATATATVDGASSKAGRDGVAFREPVPSWTHGAGERRGRERDESLLACYTYVQQHASSQHVMVGISARALLVNKDCLWINKYYANCASQTE